MPIPLPYAKKAEPPSGTTGARAEDPSREQCAAWSAYQANVGVRMADGVIAIDVDNYASDTYAAGTALHTMNELVIKVGPLPESWVSTARQDDERSGQRWYRVPPGRKWRDPGPAVQVIHRGWRYAVVAPSRHPNGSDYRWRTPRGLPSITAPTVGQLEELPAAWVQFLSEEKPRVEKQDPGLADFWQAPPQSREAAEQACRSAIASIASGDPNYRTAIMRAAMTLGGYVGAEFLPYDIATEALTSACEQIWGAADGRDQKWIEQGLNDGIERPFDVAGPSEALAGGVAEADQPDPYATMLSKLTTRGGLKEITPPVPIVDGLLYRDTLARISGQPGSMKSFIAIDQACCIATGTSFAGRTTVQGNVIYMVAEGLAGIERRVAAWEEAHPGVTIDADRLLFYPEPVQAMADEWQLLMRLVTERSPDLIVIDTQARITVGLNEDTSQDAGLFIEQVEKLRRACGACVMLIHHSPHNSERARGSTAAWGAITSEFFVLRDKDSKTVVLHNSKQKEVEESIDISFAVSPTADSVTLSHTLTVPAKPDSIEGVARGRVRQALARLERGPERALGWTRNQIAAEAVGRRTASLAAIKFYVELGWLEAVEDGADTLVGDRVKQGGADRLVVTESGRIGLTQELESDITPGTSTNGQTGQN